MANYSPEEIAAFKEKDLRISRLAILKSLIEKCSEKDVYGVDKIVELMNKYIDYVYAERRDATKRGQAGCVASNTEGIEAKPTSSAEWEQIAKGLNLAIPNAANIKILNLVAIEYKKAYKASANPSDILVHIINTYGKYPHNPESVSKVIESLK